MSLLDGRIGVAISILDEAAAFIVDGIRSRVAEGVVSGTEWEVEPIAV